MKKFSTIFTNYESIHLTKDVGMIPMAFSQVEGYAKSIIYYWDRGIDTDEKTSEEYRSYVDLSPIRAKFKLFYVLKLLLKLKFDNVTLVNLYHLSFESYSLILILKSLGFKVILKLDLDSHNLKILQKKSANFSIVNSIKKNILNICDCVTLENHDLYMQVKLLFPNVNLIYLPNGILKETVPSFVEPRDYSKRDKLIISVGRIGAYQKNHELLLEALTQLKCIGDWKILLIGPYEKSFRLKFDFFLEQNPLFSNVVEMTGNKSRNELFNIYSKSRVFLMTSRHEGFSLALLEAAFMGCYIVSTDVGGATEVTDSGRLGTLIKQGDAKDLAQKLQQIIDSDASIENTYHERKNFVRLNYDLLKVIKKVEYF